MKPTQKRIRFYNYPYEYDEAKQILCGILYTADTQPTYIPLTRTSNTTILREASTWIEDNSITTKGYYSQLKVHDIGDIINPQSIKEIIKEIVNENKQITFFGGPHKYTYYITNALIDTIGINKLIILDAHLDLKKEFMGKKFTSATFLRKITEEGKIDKIIIIGARAYQEEEIKFAEKNNIDIINNPKKLTDSISKEDQIYLSIDIDFLDSIYISETPYPEAWGYTPQDIINIFKTLIDNNVRLVGADIMEYLPIQGNHTQAKLVSRIILETLITQHQLTKQHK